jgi:hypothetical protein
MKSYSGNPLDCRWDGSGNAKLFSAIQAASTIFTGSAFRDVAVIGIAAAVATQAPATIVV